ncbi:unnamed protein product, partial [Mesorhabditis spiculigera]
MRCVDLLGIESTATTLYFIVDVLLTIVTYTGFLLQHFVLLDMYFPELEKLLEDRRWSKAAIRATEYVNRYAIVILTMALALLVPNLSEIIPLVGATCGMLLALIVPPIVETVAFYPRWSAKETPAKLSFRLLVNAVIVSFGLIFMILGVKSNLEHSIGH